MTGGHRAGMGRRPRRVAVVSVHTSPLDQPGSGDGGGLNVYVRETAARLAARGVGVDVFTRAASPDDPPVVRRDGVTVHHIDAGPRARIAKEELPSHLCAFLLGVHSRVAGADPYDLVHGHYWLSGWVGRRLRRRWGVPLVQSFHTLGRVKNGVLEPGDRPEPPLRLVAEDRLVHEADRIVVSVCGEAQELHRTYGISGARLDVVPPGVDPNVFHPGPATPVVGAPPGDGPLLLFAGRLQPLKRPDLAVRVLAEVSRVVPDVRLLIVGGESGNGSASPQALSDLAARLGVAERVAVVPARPQQELADCYRAASVLLVPSRTESFGLVALEAQACGTPVVAADVGGLRSVVAGGDLVPGHDPEAHAAAVIRLLTDRREHAAAVAAGVKRAETATWDRTLEDLLRVYDSVSARRPAVAARNVGA